MKRPGGFDHDEEPVKASHRRRPAPEPDVETGAAAPIAQPSEQPPALAERIEEPHATVETVAYEGHAPLEADDRERPADVREAKRRLKRAEKERRSQQCTEQRRFTAHIRRQRRAWMIGFSAVAGLAVFVAAGVFTPIMAVREVQIVGAHQVDEGALREAVAQFEGTPLALVDDGDVHRALEPFVQIERYALDRIPPHTLVLRIEEREAVIAVERDGVFALHDAAGVHIAETAERPDTVALAEGVVQNTKTAEFATAAQILRDMPDDLRAQVTSTSAESPRAVTFTLASGLQVVWGDASATQQKSVVLRSMITAVGTATKIDVSAPDTPVFQ